jgi:hypothetical protein
MPFTPNFNPYKNADYDHLLSKIDPGQKEISGFEQINVFTEGIIFYNCTN